MPTTELGGQSSANYYEANKLSTIEDMPQDFLSDHEEFLSDNEDANSDNKLLLNAGEGNILLGISLGTGSEYRSDSLTDSVDPEITHIDQEIGPIWKRMLNITEAHRGKIITDIIEDLPPITYDILNKNKVEDLINQKMTKEQRNF
jgi:hypothetical protein